MLRLLLIHDSDRPKTVTLVGSIHCICGRSITVFEITEYYQIHSRRSIDSRHWVTARTDDWAFLCQTLLTPPKSLAQSSCGQSKMKDSELPAGGTSCATHKKRTRNRQN